MTPLLSDLRLARQASDGDRRAFEAIYKRYHQDIYRFCLSIVGRPEDAQDALQNTMLKALRALPGEQREIRLKPWLYRVAHNESIDLLRRRREGVELDDTSSSAGAEIAETVVLRERLGRLLADLGELPVRQRSALLMRELGGLDYEQIGAAFESSSAVARQTVYEARLGLRELETGREMSCEQVTRQLSEGDGRVARRRDLRAHLRACPDCRAFRDSINGRRQDLQALAPLPAAVAASILHGLAGSNVAAGGGVGGAATAAGAGAGKVAGTSVAVKAIATAAVVATVGVTAADRGGLIDVGLPGGSKNESSKSTPTSSGGGSAADGSTAETAPHRSGAAGSNSKAGLNAAAPVTGHGRAGTSPSATSTPAEAPTRSAAEGGNGNGSPAASPTASQHGRETSAAHKATGKDKSKNHPTHPAHPSKPSHSGTSAHSKGKTKSPKESGKAAGNGQTSQPSESDSAKGPATHGAEPPGQTKSETEPTP
jgi:RNA polymerase sigma factor (sigma-70 family)